ncbi:hypothetical protein E5288_WYG004948 [Bos mutus]|uniref:Uncharacterized protein n=1 Tax=Bos mutus TaxID=72004 RepID=A0A6B0QVG4_9CETA|nr:hypothetical protein [Bos mutus]
MGLMGDTRQEPGDCLNHRAEHHPTGPPSQAAVQKPCSRFDKGYFSRREKIGFRAFSAAKKKKHEPLIPPPTPGKVLRQQDSIHQSSFEAGPFRIILKVTIHLVFQPSESVLDNGMYEAEGPRKNAALVGDAVLDID